MKTIAKIALALAITVVLLDCRTTKDLERGPEMVAVEGTGVPSSSGGTAVDAGAPAGQKEGTGPVEAVPTTQKSAEAGVAAGGGSSEEGGQKAGDDAQHPAAGPQSELLTQPQGKSGEATPLIVEKKIFVEKPIYYPETATQTPAKPAETVANAASSGVMKPKDYNGAAILYDYDESLVYQVYTMPLRVTDIYLQAGEKLVDQPFCGDTTRWNIGGGVARSAGVETQHLYVKPTEESLETTLIVNTDRRVYHLIIKSFKDTFMFSVMWRYPGWDLPLNILSSGSSEKAQSAQGSAQGTAQGQADGSRITVDPALMSMDYTVSYPKSNVPQWLPTLVLDDGSKTYIVLPETVVHHELPAVFGENGELLNFRVKDNLIIIDRLLRRIELKLRDVVVEIRKKGG